MHKHELRRETDGAREDWWKSECNELEELDKGDRSDLMYKKVHDVEGTGWIIKPYAI